MSAVGAAAAASSGSAAASAAASSSSPAPTAPRKRGFDRNDDMLTIVPLGAGNEVGRSCIVLKFKGKTIMFDCGVHPAKTGYAALPFFDEINPEEIDLLFVSHFHLDHAAALPFFTEHTAFRGRVFMTHPTRSIFSKMMKDYVRVSNAGESDMLFDDKDVENCLKRIETIAPHQEFEQSGVRFWCYNAGHVLGAAMFMVEIAGVRVLYTGDFSRQEDRHLMSAELPELRHYPHVVIVESTYGVHIHESREKREEQFTEWVGTTVRRGGRCLIPVFALGRAQELLLILEDYWAQHPELHNVKVYFASSVGSRCMQDYAQGRSFMNEEIRKKFDLRNPFQFKHISMIRGAGDFDDIGPCVVVASPAMLQSGVSREIFERWCSDKRNGMIIPGYTVEGTLAHEVLKEPTEIELSNGRKVPLRMSLHYISFSAHSDFAQTSEFLSILMPPNVVLVHGEKREMANLKRGLREKFGESGIKIMTPLNGEPVKLQFTQPKVAKVIGALAASSELRDGERMSGVLVSRHFSYQLIAAADLSTYTPLSLSRLSQRIFVPFAQPLSVAATFLASMFAQTVVANAPGDDGAIASITVCDDVVVRPGNAAGQVAVEWMAGPAVDMVADSVVACLLQVESWPAAIKVVGCMREGDAHERAHAAADVMAELYGDATVDKEGAITVTVDDKPVNLADASNEGAINRLPLRERAANLAQSAVACLQPAPPPAVPLVPRLVAPPAAARVRQQQALSAVAAGPVTDTSAEADAGAEADADADADAEAGMQTNGAEHSDAATAVADGDAMETV